MRAKKTGQALFLGGALILAVCPDSPAPAQAPSPESSGSRVPAQVHKPEACRTGDRDCLRAWFEEYATGIVREFLSYRKLEDRVARAIAISDVAAVGLLLREIRDEGLYRHNHWRASEAVPSQIESVGIPATHFEAATHDCRLAIVYMKWVLIDAQSRPENVAEGRSDYLRHARVCERAFKLGSPKSLFRERLQ